MAPSQQFHVGITASRNPPTFVQLIELTDKLDSAKRLAECFGEVEPWFHHGDCVEGDELGHDLAKMLGYKIHIHPPADNKLRAFKHGDIVETPKPYIERNHDLVDAISELIVMPDTEYEKIRSGTWATWRFAKRKGIFWTIILPDGSRIRGKGEK